MTSRRSIVLRTAFLAALGAATLVGANPASAQSLQGGYLGLNTAAHQTASLAAPAQPGSGQGGYLGRNAGADLKPAPVMEGDVKSSPMIWCQKTPGDRDICMKNAEVDHKQCMAEAPNHYEACRFAFDRMHFK
jgi:hypothetical protein